MERFKALVDYSINSLFLGKQQLQLGSKVAFSEFSDTIASITFEQNVIVVRKKDEVDRYFGSDFVRSRGYNYKRMVVQGDEDSGDGDGDSRIRTSGEL